MSGMAPDNPPYPCPPGWPQEHGHGHRPGVVAPGCCFTEPQIEAIMRTVIGVHRWTRRATRKRHFGFSCTGKAQLVPFTPNRIGALLVPAGLVWLGGDRTVTTAPGATAGVPIPGGAFVTFDEEDGSETWLVTMAPNVDVRCLELLPAPGA